jgi:hypothetical protein
MDARVADRRRHGEAVIRHQRQHLQDGGADALAAPAAEHEPQATPLVEQQRGRHHRGDPLAGRRRVEALRMQVVLPQHVVQQDARAGNDVARALAVRGGHARGVAVAVADRDVGGPAREGGAGHPPALHLLHHGDQRDQVLRRCRPLHRHRQLPEQLERERDQRPAEGGRRIGEQRAAAVGGLEGRALLHPEGRQVGGRDEAPARIHVPVHASGQLSPVEVLRAAGQLAEEGGEVGVAQTLALAQQLAAGCEDRAAVGGQGHDRAQQLEEVGLVGVEHDALAGQRDGGRHHLPQRQAALPTVDVQEAGDRAGHGDRAHPAVEDLIGAGEADGHRQEVGLAQSGRAAAPRRIDEEVVADGAAIPSAREQEAAATEAGECGLAYRGGEARGEGRVAGVAAGSQHARRRLAGRVVARRHDTGIRRARAHAIRIE